MLLPAQLELLPDLLFTAPDHKFLVYTYQAGSSRYKSGNKMALLSGIVRHYMNHYQPAGPELGAGAGYLDELQPDWKGFCLARAAEANAIIGSVLSEEDHNKVANLIRTMEPAAGQDRYLLHGDLGVHNLLFDNDGRLCGIIDPQPVIGPPAYDLIYAFCSSPDDLSYETISAAFEQLAVGTKQDRIYEEVLVGLYFRISTCLKHHPHDLQAYLDAWERWRPAVEQ